MHAVVARAAALAATELMSSKALTLPLTLSAVTPCCNLPPPTPNTRSCESSLCLRPSCFCGYPSTCSSRSLSLALPLAPSPPRACGKRLCSRRARNTFCTRRARNTVCTQHLHPTGRVTIQPPPSATLVVADTRTQTHAHQPHTLGKKTRGETGGTGGKTHTDDRGQDTHRCTHRSMHAPIQEEGQETNTQERHTQERHTQGRQTSRTGTRKGDKQAGRTHAREEGRERTGSRQWWREKNGPRTCRRAATARGGPNLQAPCACAAG